MNLLCGVCDRSIIEKSTEYHKYLATLREENNESLYENYTIKC